MRVIDCTVRLVPTARRILAWERGASYPDGIERRMMSFAFQTLTSTLVSLIVWDRSEFVLLKHLCKDIRQLAFYSVAFNLADRLLLGATVFGTAIAATMFAQYGRDKSQLPRLTSSAFRYLALISIPLHAIATALIAPLMLLLYGRQYSDAALVVTIAPLLCLPKAFMTPIQSLFQSFERQSLVILVTLVAGVADLSTAWLLISRHGAIGACIGSGVGQFSAIALLWGIAINWFGLRLPWSFLAKVAASSGAAFAAAYFIAANLPPLFGVSLGAAGACAVFLLGLYLLRALQNEDLSRFWMTACKLPAVVSRPLYRLMQILVRSPQSLVVPEQVA
jgi:O-antigen/teichoic acid export membrane protein